MEVDLPAPVKPLMSTALLSILMVTSDGEPELPSQSDSKFLAQETEMILLSC